MGHGQKVGDEHYTMLTDDMYELVTNPKSAAQGSGKWQNGSEANEPMPERQEKKAAVSTDKTRGNAADNEVVRGGFEPPTHGFSVHCSTN